MKIVKRSTTISVKKLGDSWRSNHLGVLFPPFGLRMGYTGSAMHVPLKRICSIIEYQLSVPVDNIEQLVLFGSSVYPHVSIHTMVSRKYLLFGERRETEYREVKDPADIDLAVIVKSTPTDSNYNERSQTVSDSYGTMWIKRVGLHIGIVESQALEQGMQDFNTTAIGISKGIVDEDGDLSCDCYMEDE